MAMHAAYWRMGVAGLEGTVKMGASALEDGITVLAIDKDSNVLLCLSDSSAHIPSTKAGYAVGCILIDQQASVGTLYSNRGTVLSCTFTQVNA